MTYYPTSEAARTVEMWTRAGIGKERIAARLGVTVPTLEQHYPFELGYTDEESLAIVADVAFQMASSGKSPQMTKFWLETKGGWQAGFMSAGGPVRKPLEIIVDPEVVAEGEFEEVEEADFESLTVN